MYPIVRFLKEVIKFHNAPRLDLCASHVSHHRCWPWDLDPWIELNNGRTLTLYDLGRIPMAQRTGLAALLKVKGWGITVAGNTTRYRRRIRAFERFELRSRCIGWDARFFYVEQAMWKGQDCANHILIRNAITSSQGIVPTAEVLSAMGRSDVSPALPDWVNAWIAADAQRPWPPEDRA
ncbi:MAG: acyl-CoA thioesterase [Rhodobacteraceae bacterium]|nr:MAG: acyl-CoA thioesterase [Paracoccaceae bacterium]